MVCPQAPSSCFGSSAASGESCPLLDVACKEVQSWLGKHLCYWQYKVTAEILKQNHMFATVATGMGKTLSFLVPVLFRPNGVLVIVTPLNIFGNQIEELLEKARIPAISINRETATNENYKVRFSNLYQYTYLNPSQNICKGKFRVVIISPEQTIKEKGGSRGYLRTLPFVHVSSALCLIRYTALLTGEHFGQSTSTLPSCANSS